MKRITLILGVVAVMAAMMAALAAPAMAKDNNGHKGDGNNRHENRLDNRFDRFDNQRDFLVSDVGFSSVLVTDKGLADELCSPLSSDAINHAIPGCIFGDRNDDLDIGFVSGVNRVGNVGFVSGIDDGRFVDVDFDRGIHFANDNNHNGNNHNGGNGPKGHGK